MSSVVCLSVCSQGLPMWPLPMMLLVSHRSQGIPPDLFKLVHQRMSPPMLDPSPRPLQTCPLGRSPHSLALPPPRPVQTCSLSRRKIYRQMGSWSSTEKPSCYRLQGKVMFSEASVILSIEGGREWRPGGRPTSLVADPPGGRSPVLTSSGDHCSASCWNAFLFSVCFDSLSHKSIKCFKAQIWQLFELWC